MSKNTNNREHGYYSYGVRFPVATWERFQLFLERENKRIGRAQNVSEVLRQCFEKGLTQLERESAK